MTYINQLDLSDRKRKLNKFFFRLVHECRKFEDVEQWFDKLDCKVSLRRMPDEDMTIDDFVKGLAHDPIVKLQIRSPSPYEIGYFASFRDGGVSRFAWLKCPSSDHNFSIMKELYMRAFDTGLEDEPVIKGLREYHDWRKEHYNI